MTQSTRKLCALYVAVALLLTFIVSGCGKQESDQPAPGAISPNINKPNVAGKMASPERANRQGAQPGTAGKP